MSLWANVLRYNLTLGFRSTNTTANDVLQLVANQRVEVASVTIAGRVRFKYWNDHAFWWWPMGAWRHISCTQAPSCFEQVNLTLRWRPGFPIVRAQNHG